MAAFGNSHHLWMWDTDSLTHALKNAGFNKVFQVDFNDSEDKSFIAVEDSSRFWGAIALEAIK